MGQADNVTGKDGKTAEAPKMANCEAVVRQCRVRP